MGRGSPAPPPPPPQPPPPSPPPPPDFLHVILGEETQPEAEEDPADLWTAVTFIVLFLLSLCYSTGVTVFKVWGGGWGWGAP